LSKRKPVDVVMAGPDLRGQGGIVTVVTILLAAGLFQRNAGAYVVSHAALALWGRVALALLAFWRMAVLCWRDRPAIVHVHSATHGSFIRKSLLLSIARRFGCATVMHLHGSRFRQYARDEAGWLRRRWVARCLRRSSAVIALSDSWARFVRELTPQASVHVIANAVVVSAAPAPPAAGPCRILFLGQVGERKGIYELVQALALVKDEYPDARLIVGGAGELDYLARLAREYGVAANVELLGWIGDDERERQLAQATLFCLPSHNEGLPVAMLEAMAAARPVIVTPVGGIPDAIDDGDNGLLVPPGDVAALAAALRRLIGDAMLCRQLGLHAHRTIVERFQADAMVQQLERLYAELHATRRADQRQRAARPVHLDTDFDTAGDGPCLTESARGGPPGAS